MSIDWAAISTDTWKVLAAGLLFGAGLPFLFAIGIRMWDQGEGGIHVDGTATARKPAQLTVAYAMFALIAAVVVVAVLYLTKASIAHYLGVHLF